MIRIDLKVTVDELPDKAINQLVKVMHALKIYYDFFLGIRTCRRHT